MIEQAFLKGWSTQMPVLSIRGSLFTPQVLTCGLCSAAGNRFVWRQFSLRPASSPLGEPLGCRPPTIGTPCPPQAAASKGPLPSAWPAVSFHRPFPQSDGTTLDGTPWTSLFQSGNMPTVLPCAGPPGEGRRAASSHRARFQLANLSRCTFSAR